MVDERVGRVLVDKQKPNIMRVYVDRVVRFFVQLAHTRILQRLVVLLTSTRERPFTMLSVAYYYNFIIHNGNAHDGRADMLFHHRRWFHPI
jgi:hypothetical protein